MPPALSPRLWGGHLLMVLMLAAAIGLGVWQFGSWEDQRTAKAVDLARVTPVPVADALGPDAPFPGLDVGRPVVLRGRWDPRSTVYVSDREHDGVRGFWVVTPLVQDGSGSAMPVVRGWVREPAAAPAPPSGDAALVGWLQPTEDTGAPDTDPSDDVLPELTIADLVQRTPQDLYGAYAVLAHGIEPGDWPSGSREVNAGDAGLAAVAPPQLPSASAFTGLRNLLYAVEWWIFGLFAVYVWWRWLRETLDGTDAAQDRADDGPDDDPVDGRGEGPEEETHDTVAVGGGPGPEEASAPTRTVIS